MPPDECGRHTSQQYWENHWSNLGVDRKVIDPHHYFYGERGILIRALRALSPEAPPLRSVCEFGGAGSYYLLALHRWFNASATCIDYSAAGLDLTKRIFEAAGEPVELIHSDLEAHDFGERRFDLITHWGVIEHFEDPTPLFCLTGRLLSPIGITFFSMPNMLALGARWWRKYCPTNWHTHVRHSDEFIAECVREAGLELVGTRCIGRPLVKIARWERRGLLPPVLTVANRLSCILEAALPGLWVNSPQWYGQHRLFCARRRATDE